MPPRPAPPTSRRDRAEPVSTSRAAQGGNSGAMLPRDVEATLAEINASYAFMTEQDYQEVPFALQILDGPGGRSLRSFENMRERLNPCLDVVVSEHNASFNFSVQYYSETTETIGTTQAKITEMRRLLMASRENLHLHQFDLVSLWEKSQTYSEMLRIISLIEDLRQAPAKIENLLISKYYFSAVQRLLEATAIAKGPDCGLIGAIDDVRKSLATLREKIFDAIVNDIGSHVYLKSPFSEDRWTNFVRQSATDCTNSKPTNMTSFINHRRSSILGKHPAVLASTTARMEIVPEDLVTGRSNSPALAALDASMPGNDIFVREDLTVSPEIDSLAFITICLESLCILGGLHEGLVQMRQRIPAELFALIEHNIAESRKTDFVGAPGPESRMRIMQDFCLMLYAKLESVLECHRLICNVADVMSRRDSFTAYGNDPALLPVYSTNDICMAMLEEIRLVILNHLAISGSAPQQLALDFYRVLKPDEFIFKFTKSSLGPTMATVYNTHLAVKGPETAPAHVPDPYSSEKVLTHQSLFGPDIEYISTIYRPTLDFIKQMRLYSPGSDESAAADEQFLEDFIVNTYIPSTETKVQAHVHKYIDGADGFVVNEENLLQSAPCLVNLIKALCTTIKKVPFQKKEYVRMIQDVLWRYLDKCQAKFRLCTSYPAEGDYKNCNSRGWIDDGALMDLVTRSKYYLIQQENDEGEPADVEIPSNSDHLVHEILIQSKLAGTRSFQRSELIFEKKKLELLAYMRVTLKWFAKEVKKVMTSKDDDALLLQLTNNMSNDSLFANVRKSAAMCGSLAEIAEEMQAPLWDSEQGGAGQFSTDEVEAVPQQSMATISSILQSFKETSDLCLVTLRLELRCHTMYFVNLAMREGSYELDDETGEPEPYVLQLNSDIIVFEELLGRCLSENDSFFVFEGLSLLMAHMLVSDAGCIRSMNSAGAHKIVKSIQALHQNLLNIALCTDMRLDHARKYYELFDADHKAILASIEGGDTAFTLDEFVTMLDFIFNVRALPELQKSENIEVSAAATTAIERHRASVARVKELLGAGAS